MRKLFQKPCLIQYSSGIISFGGTDSQYHYNDTWTYDTTTRTWGELHCIGFIPSPREGHSAALVDDVVYVYGGRGVDGKDLGDLGAFKISSTYPMQRRYFLLRFIRPDDELIIFDEIAHGFALQIKDGTCSRTWVRRLVPVRGTPWHPWVPVSSCWEVSERSL